MRQIQGGFIICSIILLLFTLIIPDTLQAQGLSLSLSPPIVEIIIKPGKTETHVYKLRNNGDPVIVIPRLVEYEGGIKENNNYQKENWIELIGKNQAFNSPQLLKNQEEKQFILKISPPKDIKEQDVYRVLLFSTLASPQSELSQTAITQTLGSVLFITISSTGKLDKKVAISNFKLPTLIDSFGPLLIEAEAINSGSNFTRIEGLFKLRNMLGTADYPIIPHIIPAGQKRILNTSFNRNQSSSLWINGFYLGKYDVELELSLDAGKIKVRENKSVLALPWKMALLVLTLLLLVIIIKKVKRSIVLDIKSLKK